MAVTKLGKINFLRFTKCLQNNHVNPFSTHHQVLLKKSKLDEVGYASTVDSEEMYKFTKLKECWWDPDGIMSPLQTYNVLRVPFIRDGLIDNSKFTKLSTCLQDKKILDVGCGGGVLTEELAKFGADITGIDSCKDLLDLAKYHSANNERLKDNMPKYICTTVEEHCENFPEHYDAIVCSEVIEHVVNQQLFIDSCARALKPGGKMFFTTPNRTRLSYLVGIVYFEYIIRNIVRGGHDFNKFLTPLELKYMFERANCSVEFTKGVLFRYWVNSWRWSESDTFMYVMRAVKLG